MFHNIFIRSTGRTEKKARVFYQNHPWFLYLLCFFCLTLLTDDSSSVEVSPVKKIAFSSNTIRFGAKERKPVEAGKAWIFPVRAWICFVSCASVHVSLKIITNKNNIFLWMFSCFSSATGEGSLDFGIKTLSQLRKTNDIRGFSTSQAAVGEPVTKAGSQRKFISLRNGKSNILIYIGSLCKWNILKTFWKK